MFKNLTNFSYKRNWKEALGFYLAFGLLAMFLGGLVGILQAAMSTGQDITVSKYLNEHGSLIMIMSSLYCFIVAIIILGKKKLFKNFGYILLSVLTAILAVVGGALLGLIVPAFMTTRQPLE
jgi:hypothetical protein